MAAIQDGTLVINALRMAIAHRRPEAGLLHHTDRGSTYTSEDYQALLQQEGMVASMSRTADYYDNAAMESFFHSFKGECIDCQSFQTRAQARSTTFDDIEIFYNRTRRHSTLHYLSPLEYEQVMCSIPSLGSPQKRVRITCDSKFRLNGPHVKYLQLLENGLPGLGSGPKGVAIHAFLFDCSKKALHQRILVTIGFFAPAHLKAIAFQESEISLTRLLAATIGVVQQAWMWSSSDHSHHERISDQLLIALISHGPTDHHSRGDIDNPC